MSAIQLSKEERGKRVGEVEGMKEKRGKTKSKERRDAATLLVGGDRLAGDSRVVGEDGARRLPAWEIGARVLVHVQTTFTWIQCFI